MKGTSTADEEQTLRDEGVESFNIPVPKEGNWRHGPRPGKAA